MRVKMVAHTIFLEENTKEFGYIPHWDYADIENLPEDDEQGWWDILESLPKGIDELAEFAGRNCYQAWERNNPATQTNKGYIGNILNQKHYSVLEHGSATFAVDGVSTALLGQLSRHRHLSFSVLSQRFVNKGDSKLVVHPGLKPFLEDNLYPDTYEYPFPVSELLEDALTEAIRNYELLVRFLTEKKGLSRKQAREAARTVLPQGIETCIVVTGNMRAWRDVLAKRNDEHADAEIHEFAQEVLSILKTVAPNSFQDME